MLKFKESDIIIISPPLETMTQDAFNSFDKRLEDFLLLAQHKSYTKVGQLQGQSQSAISRSIQKLETQLGVSLVDRHTYPISLTTSGETLRRCLVECTRVINRTVSDIQRQNYLKPVMHMGMIDSVARLLAVPLIKNSNRYASEFSLSVGSANVLLRQLLNKELDFILVNEAFAEIPDLQRQFIYSEPWYLALPPSLAKKDNWNWNQLRLCGLPFIHSPKHTGDGRFLETFFSILSISLPRHYVTNSNDVLVASITADLGWSLLRPTIVAQTHADQSSKLKLQPLPDGFHAETKFYLIGRANEYQHEFDLYASQLCELVSSTLYPNLKNIVPDLDIEDLNIGNDASGI